MFSPIVFWQQNNLPTHVNTAKPTDATSFAVISAYAGMTAAQLAALPISELIVWIAVTATISPNPTDPNFADVTTAFNKLTTELDRRNL